MYFKVSLYINEIGKEIVSSLGLGDLKISTLENGLQIGVGVLKFTDGGINYGHGIIWSYFDGKDIWHEILISNSSIEIPSGFFTADYEVTVAPPIGYPSSVTRQGARFYDGTGYLELIGKPKLRPSSEDLAFYTRHFPNDINPFVSYAKATATTMSQLDAFPHTEWSAEDWSTKTFDPAKNTHQTGSPRNIGYAWDKAAALISLYKSDQNHPLLDKYVNNIYGFIGQQSRRPIHFMHSSESILGSIFLASQHPKAVMSEYGPSKLWSSTDLLGREKFTAEQAKRGQWNSWDLEHLSVDQLVAGFILFGSQYCFLQIRLILEGLMTHPHLKTVKTSISSRVYGWNLRALAWGTLINPIQAETLKYHQAATNLLETYKTSMLYSPIPVVFPQKAAGDHLYPKAKDMFVIYEYKGYEYPTTPEYLTLKDNFDKDPVKYDNALVKSLVGHVYNKYGYDDLLPILDTWSFVSVFQLAVAASGTMLYNETFKVGSADCAKILQHILYCIYLKGNNPNGTFWYDYGAFLQAATSGNGVDKAGVNIWVAGAIGMLLSVVPEYYKPTMISLIKKIYENNQYTTPENSIFYSWLVPTAKAIGYPGQP